MERNVKAALLRKIGRNIADAREARRIERKQLADFLGITPSACGDMENGKTDTTISESWTWPIAWT